MSKGFEAICPKCGTLQDYSCPVCETNKKKYNEIKDKGEMKNKHSPGIWLYVLVFMFSGIWFQLFCLDTLLHLREARTGQIVPDQLPEMAS